MIRLIGIDMDGTLLDDQKIISEENKKSIKEAREKGIQVVMATGRPFCPQMVNYYKELEMYQKGEYLVALNGAEVVDIYTREVIYQETIYGRDVHEIQKFAKRFPEVHYQMFQKDACFYEKMNEFTMLEKTVNLIPIEYRNFELVEEDEPVFKMMLVGNEHDIEKAYQQIPDVFFEKYTIVRSTRYYIEFIHKNVSKYVGLKNIAVHLSIPEDTIMAIGDADNDVDMLVHATISVAMANAFEEVQKKAKYLTKSNNESGVAYAIRKWALKD